MDLHVDLPPKPDSVQGKQDGAKLAFNKIVETRYRDGSSGYSEIGVLLVSWDEDDMNVADEVDMLQDVFSKRFGFKAESFKIPSENSSAALYAKMQQWANDFEGAHRLSIIYYAGHGSHVDGDKSDLGIHGTRQGSRADTFFRSSFDPLCMTDTDTLLIVDCCFAALAFSQEKIGRRKFELLCSVAPGELAYGPDHASSFTKVLCNALENLLETNKQRGFSTSQLYRELYHKSTMKKKPFLFDQSSKNFGWISIRPMSLQASENTADNVAIELRLEMSKLPSVPEMQDLAACMQYLPLVRSLEFQHLHAPEQRLDDFFKDLLKRQRIRPFIRILRQKVAMKRNMKFGVPESNESKRVARGDVPDRYDWAAESVLYAPNQLPRRASFPVKRLSRQSTVVGSEDSRDNCVDSKVTTHTIGNLLSFRLSLTGINPIFSNARKRYAEFSPVKRLLYWFGIVTIFFLEAFLRWLNSLCEWARPAVGVTSD